MDTKVRCIHFIHIINQWSIIMVYLLSFVVQQIIVIYIYCTSIYIFWSIISLKNFILFRERPFNLKGGVMVFCFVQNFFFGQHKSQNIYFLSRKARIFFPEFNIRLYDKNSESDYFFFPPPKSEYFFPQHWESEYFFRKKP